MTIKVGINGFGRIGRCVVRALAMSERKDIVNCSMFSPCGVRTLAKIESSKIEIVHINDLCDIDLSAHLLRYDTTHGRFPGEVKVTDGALEVNGKKIGYSSERDVKALPWGKLDIDVVMECTGIFASRDKAAAHLDAGARKVLVSAPASGADKTIVYGINHDELGADDLVVSNASCTTNCLAPVVKVLHDNIGIESGWMSTVHAYTNDQVTLDGPHSDYRRARSAAESIIPTRTGAASAIGLVIPELKGKMSGIALRVPVRNVSIVDLTFVASRKTSSDEINKLIKEAAQGDLEGILEACEEPVVSSDFNGHPASSIFDCSETSVDSSGTHAKVLSWYDNEWGFSCRMLDTTAALANAS